MFRSQCSTMFSEVRTAQVATFEELKAIVEETHAPVYNIELINDIEFKDSVDVGGKQVSIRMNNHTITNSSGTWLFRNKKPACTFSSVELISGNTELNGGGIFLGSNSIASLRFSGASINVILSNGAMIAEGGSWQQMFLVLYGNFVIDEVRPIINLTGGLILTFSLATLKNINGNTINWSDVIGGIVKDSNGIPRNVLSNIIL